jgi:hypothetical protein
VLFAYFQILLEAENTSIADGVSIEIGNKIKESKQWNDQTVHLSDESAFLLALVMRALILCNETHGCELFGVMVDQCACSLGILNFLDHVLVLLIDRHDERRAWAVGKNRSMMVLTPTRPNKFARVTLVTCRWRLWGSLGLHSDNPGQLWTI